MMGLAAPSALGSSPVTVAVVDSGIDAGGAAPLNVAACYDVRDPTAMVEDSDGHGTVVASLIDSVAPRVPLHVYRVADDRAYVYEWDVLAGLTQASGADIINLSASFGDLPEKSCTVCGRRTHSVRSAVFQTVMYSLANLPRPPIVVVAAGNRANARLDFPARYSQAIAVGAVDSSRTLYSLSNHGTAAADGTAHPNVFLAPGGQQGTVSESVGSIRTTEYHGTSFSTAYVSGILARHLSTGMSRAAAITQLQHDADATYTSYAPSHGHGIVKA